MVSYGIPWSPVGNPWDISVRGGTKKKAGWTIFGLSVILFTHLTAIISKMIYQSVSCQLGLKINAIGRFPKMAIPKQDILTLLETSPVRQAKYVVLWLSGYKNSET